MRSEASSAAPRSELAWAAAPALVKKPATLERSARQRAEDLFGVGGELGELVALGRENAEEAIGVAQHRVGPLHHFFDVFAVAGEAGAEFVEDQAEALRVGKLLDVVDQVRVDAGAVVLQRQQVLTGARFARGDLFQFRRRLRPRRPRQRRVAVDELLADQRLRADQAARVAAEVLEARVFDLHRDHRLAGDRLRLAVLVAVDLARLRHADRFDFADVGAGHAHQLALDHEGAVVEDRADDVAPAAAGTAGEQDDDHDDRRDQPGCDQRFPHGPGGASAGSHSVDGWTPEPAKGGSVNGLEPSASGLGPTAGAGLPDAGRFAERFELPARRDRFELAPVVLEDVEVAELDAGVVAVGVVVAGDLAELAEAVEDVGRVGAGEVEVRLEGDGRFLGVGEGPAGALFDRRQGGEQFGAVVGEALAGDAESQVLEHRHGLGQHRAQFGQERRQVLRRRLRRFEQRFDVVERGAEVDEGRVALPEDRRQQSQGPVEGGVLAGDRAEGGARVGDRAGELAAALGDRGGELAGADHEAPQQRLVGIQFVRGRRRCG